MRIFVSHSSEDRKYVERRLLPALRKAGLHPWYAQDAIIGGATWTKELVEGLESSDATIVVATPNAVDKEWVRTEITLASDRKPKMRVITCIVRACEVKKIYPLLVDTQHVDLRLRGGVNRLIVALMTRRPPESPRWPWLRTWRVWAVAAAVLLVCVALALRARGVFSKHSAEAPYTAPLIHVSPEQKLQAAQSGVEPIYTNSVGMRFVIIPGGTFQMGTPETEPGLLEKDERPQHAVTISPCYVQVTETTNAQFRAFAPGHHSPVGFDGDHQPTVNVSYADAVAFATSLSRREGGGSTRLPTEAEWEYACRAGTNTRYSFGSDITADQAVFALPSGSTTKPVGSCDPNPWGLYDMHGNVWEWCSDWKSENYETDSGKGTVLNPPGPSSGSDRVVRGGGWDSVGDALRSAYRLKGSPGEKQNLVRGFRVVRELR